MPITYNPLKCTGCALEFPFPRGSFFYSNQPLAMPGTEATAQRGLTPFDGAAPDQFCDIDLQPAWCKHCNCATFTERVPSMREFIVAEGLRRTEHTHGAEDELLSMDETRFRWLYQHLAGRSEPLTCLLCGGGNFIPIEWKRQTSLTHDACWDSAIEFQFMTIWSGVYRRGNHTCRVYDTKGKFRWAVVDFVSGDQYRGQAVFHVARPGVHHDALARIVGLLVRGSVADAVEHLMPLVAGGVPEALGIAGALHFLGNGVAHDGALAESMLSTAKAAGLACAAHNLAALYAQGAPGIAPDEARAPTLP